MAPRPAGGGDEGFVLLEGTETINTQMQAAAQGPMDPSPVVEYELASFRRTLSNTSSLASKEEDGDDEEEEEEELKGMPKDLKGLCRFLRAQAAGAGGAAARATTTTLPAAGEEASGDEGGRRVRAPRKCRGIHGFLCFAWPIGTRELLFWVLLAVFMITLVTLGGGRTRVVVGPPRANPLSSSSTDPPGTCSASTSPIPIYHHFKTETSSATSAVTPSTPPRAPAAVPKREHVLSPYTELSLLRAQLRAENLLAHDREHELAWMKASQYELETKVDCLTAKIKALEQDLERASSETSSAFTSSPLSPPPLPTSTIRVVPEVRTVQKEEEEEEKKKEESNGWWFTSEMFSGNGNGARAREAVGVNGWNGGRGLEKPVEVAAQPQSSPLTYGDMVCMEEDQEEEEWLAWSEEEEEEDSDDEWDSDDDSDWEEWDDEDWSDDEEDEWWSDEEEEEEEEWVAPQPMSPFLKVDKQRWDEVVPRNHGVCHTACAAPHWFALTKKAFRVEPVCELRAGGGLTGGFSSFV